MTTKPPTILQLHTAAPEHSARAAQLKYVRRRTNGIERLGSRKNFRYRQSGTWVRDKETLQRIRQLAIPPAWKEVWICPDPNGHLQAAGLDARGRWQYRYHAGWSAMRNATKFAHALEFGRQLPQMRKRMAKDLERHGLPLEKVLAAVVSIMDHTHIRVGHDAYAKENGSFGLSTLKDRHAQRDGAGVRFVFKGKTGIQHDIRLGSSRLSRLVMRCKELPGQDLFQYVDADGEPRPIDSGMVNDYIRSITDGRFTSKDIRTWKGTVHGVRALLAQGFSHTVTARKRKINAALDEVALQLGNTRAVCRKYYVHPGVIQAYGTNTLRNVAASVKGARGMLHEERVVLRLLGRRMETPRTPESHRKAA